MEEKKARKKGSNFTIEYSSGGVVFKKIPSSDSKYKILWLITRSTPSEVFPKPIWRLPKGWLDDQEDGKKPGLLTRGESKITDEILRKSALREVKEEGGVEAKIISKIGTEKFFFTKNKNLVLKFVTFYLMEWLRDLPDGPGFETSEIAWLDFNKASEKLNHKKEKMILEKAKEILDSGLQESLV